MFTLLARNATRTTAQLDVELKKGNVETKKAALGVLRELVTVRQGSLEEHLPNVVPHVVDGIKSEVPRLLLGFVLGQRLNSAQR